MDLAKEIISGLEKMEIETSDKQRDLFQQYLVLLEKWNKAYNLTAIKDLEQMLILHLFDSLSISRFINKNNNIDVGTGAGLPGIPLAILLPDKSFTLLDSNGKKTRFQQQVKTELKLENIFPLQQRVEDYNDDQKYDAVISRAFASIQDMLNGCHQFCAADGEFLAMKGEIPEVEVKELDNRFILKSVEALHVPGLDAQRHLLRIGFNR